jgi:hypothetical protein
MVVAGGVGKSSSRQVAPFRARPLCAACPPWNVAAMVALRLVRDVGIWWEISAPRALVKEGAREVRRVSRGLAAETSRGGDGPMLQVPFRRPRTAS